MILPSHMDASAVLSLPMHHDAATHLVVASLPPQDDLVCLPHKVSSSLGHLGPIVLCTKVSNQITLTDPVTLRSTSMDVRG